MSTIAIRESGMDFMVDEDYLFRIEGNGYVKSIQGLKSCEYVEWSNGNLVFLEAKTSFPHPANSKESFADFIGEITSKFEKSFQLFVSVLTGRLQNKPQLQLAPSAAELKLTDVEVIFYLVIKNHQKDWLPPVLNKLKSELRLFMKCWNIKDTSIKVLNEEMARSKGLIA